MPLDGQGGTSGILNFFCMFPLNSYSTSTEITGIGTRYFTTSYDVIVLGVNMQQSGAQSETLLKCNDSVIAHNFAKDYPFVALNYRCVGNLWVDKTGMGDTAFVSITAIKTGSSTVLFGFSQGEVIISLFIFVGLMFGIFGLIINHFGGIRYRHIRN